MKFSLVFATLILSASAYRCKFDRIKNGMLTPLCSDSDKVGDQTENDKCSDKRAHTETNSSTVHHGTPGDPNCRLIITAGGGCDADDTVLSTVPCIPGSRMYVQAEHAYKVVCD
ncbi:hypothetical protein HD806DRAFT_532944 [Xylariaceae sp. AK1471]|nr:hypothetical protein HD806DRAFT_532944 [Xylariaceae sp. AK1471]